MVPSVIVGESDGIFTSVPGVEPVYWMKTLGASEMLRSLKNYVERHLVTSFELTMRRNQTKSKPTKLNWQLKLKEL